MPTARRGFTLLELLIVVAIVALASAVSTLALRDPDATRLEREALRLATLLDAARAQSRAMGTAITWRPATAERRSSADFEFTGLPPGQQLPTRWLGSPGQPPVQVELPPGSRELLLGPEPVIGAQRLLLRLDQQRAVLTTDGLGPFRLEAP